MSREQRETVRRQFERQARAYSRNEVVAERSTLDYVAAVAKVAATDRVLDVACGPGLLAAALAERARACVGVDVTEALLRTARDEIARLGLTNATLVRADVEALPLRSASFDVAACKFAFHHFDDPGRVLAEMARVTRRGGRIVILDMIGSEDPERRALHDRIERWCDPSHAGALPPSRFERLFAGSGLAVRYARKGERPESLASWLDHGGPPPQRRAEISAEAARLRGEDLGGIRFDGEVVTHVGMTWVLEKTGQAGPLSPP